MTTLVHRRTLQPVVAEPRGPGGTIGPILARYTAPLTWIGWLSILGAAGYLIWRVPLLWQGAFSDESGEFNPVHVLGLLPMVGNAALILLPAAVELGYPNVARRNRWLRTGAALIALQRVGSTASGPLSGLVLSAGLGQDGSADTDPAVVVQGMVLAVDVGLAVVLVAGWLAFAYGLWRAGARPSQSVLMVVVGAVVVLQALVLGIEVLSADWTSVSGVTLGIFGVRILIAFADAAATAALTITLLWGAKEGLLPRRAWRIAVIAAFMSAIALVFGQFVILVLTSDLATLALNVTLDVAAAWPLLLMVACLAGLGRGEEAWRPWPPRRRSYFIVYGERRLRADALPSGPLGAQPSESR
jgi:hypothetical protein